MNKFVEIKESYRSIWFWLIFVLYFIQGLFLLNSRPLDLDELGDHSFFCSPEFSKAMGNVLSFDLHSPVFRLFSYPFCHGENESFFFLPSFLFSLISLFLMYSLVLKFAKKETALVATLFQALSFSQVFYSHSLRSYSLFYMGSLIFLHFILDDLYKKEWSVSKKILAVLIYLVSHYFSLFHIGFYFLYKWVSNKKILKSDFKFIGLSLPFICYFTYQFLNQTHSSVNETFNSPYMIRVIQHGLFDMVHGHYSSSLLNSYSGALSVLILLSILFFGFKKLNNPYHRHLFFQFLLLGIIFSLAGYVLNFKAKYLIFVDAYLFILCALILTQFKFSKLVTIMTILFLGIKLYVFEKPFSLDRFRNYKKMASTLKKFNDQNIPIYTFGFACYPDTWFYFRSFAGDSLCFHEFPKHLNHKRFVLAYSSDYAFSKRGENPDAFLDLAQKRGFELKARYDFNPDIPNDFKILVLEK